MRRCPVAVHAPTRRQRSAGGRADDRAPRRRRRLPPEVCPRLVIDDDPRQGDGHGTAPHEERDAPICVTNPEDGLLHDSLDDVQPAPRQRRRRLPRHEDGAKRGAESEGRVVLGHGRRIQRRMGAPLRSQWTGLPEREHRPEGGAGDPEWRIIRRREGDHINGSPWESWPWLPRREDWIEGRVEPEGGIINGHPLRDPGPAPGKPWLRSPGQQDGPEPALTERRIILGNRRERRRQFAGRKGLRPPNERWRRRIVESGHRLPFGVHDSEGPVGQGRRRDGQEQPEPRRRPRRHHDGFVRCRHPEPAVQHVEGIVEDDRLRARPFG